MYLTVNPCKDVKAEVILSTLSFVFSYFAQVGKKEGRTHAVYKQNIEISKEIKTNECFKVISAFSLIIKISHFNDMKEQKC